MTRNTTHAGLLLLLATGLVLGGSACSKSRSADQVDVSTPQVPGAPADDTAKLNIVLIVADDLGVNDVGYNGNQAIRTPNLDALAARSTVFSSAYASSPVCSTSRAGLITGLHQQRFGMESNPSLQQLAARTVLDSLGAQLVPEVLGDPPHPKRGLPPEAVTIAERLKEVGYKTAHIGKWHLGSAEGYTPTDQGFDEFYGFLGGASMFAERDNPDVVGARLTWSGLDNFLWERLSYSLEHNGEPQAERGYQTDVFGTQGARFIDEAGDQPFFLSVAFNAPHNPLQAPKHLVDAQPADLPERQRVYYAMIESLDQNLGVLLDALETTGVRDRTLIIVTSDNGGASYIRIDDVNSPYRGFKANFWEGGIRVPLVIDHPGEEASSVIDTPVSLLDMAPLILSSAGVEIDALDGHSPFTDLEDETRTLLWRNNTLTAIRYGDWKLIQDKTRNRVWLYDLRGDPGEQNNLADARPQIVADLISRFDAGSRDWPVKPAWAPTYLSPVHADPVENTLEADNDDWTYWPG